MKSKKKYLQPETVALLDTMALKAKLVVEGYIIGKHQSPYHGFSVEFAEHRSYETGDEIRHIDWKLFGKTDRLYVKRYQEETNLSSHIILDSSKSMLYKSGNISKLAYANSLVAALSYLMISQQDAVGLVKFSNKINKFLPAKSKPSYLNQILKQLDDKNSDKDTKIESVLHEMAERINKRGLIILFSDLLDEPDDIINGLKHFRHKKQEVIVFHILDRKEFEFDFDTRTQFLDMETGEHIITEPWLIKDNYQQIIDDLKSFYKKECQENSIDYVPIYTDESFEKSLTAYLNKRKKLN